jgi:hypothetical protein
VPTTTVPEFIVPTLTKTIPNCSFSVIENEETGSINSGTGYTDITIQDFIESCDYSIHKTDNTFELYLIRLVHLFSYWLARETALTSLDRGR